MSANTMVQKMQIVANSSKMVFHRSYSSAINSYYRNIRNRAKTLNQKEATLYGKALAMARTVLSWPEHIIAGLKIPLPFNIFAMQLAPVIGGIFKAFVNLFDPVTYMNFFLAIIGIIKTSPGPFIP